MRYILDTKGIRIAIPQTSEEIVDNIILPECLPILYAFNRKRAIDISFNNLDFPEQLNYFNIKN